MKNLREIEPKVIHHDVEFWSNLSNKQLEDIKEKINESKLFKTEVWFNRNSKWLLFIAFFSIFGVLMFYRDVLVPPSVLEPKNLPPAVLEGILLWVFLIVACLGLMLVFCLKDILFDELNNLNGNPKKINKCLTPLKPSDCAEMLEMIEQSSEVKNYCKKVVSHNRPFLRGDYGTAQKILEYERLKEIAEKEKEACMKLHCLE